ncbi:hypothetical protein SAMD00019534_050750 [Acytostelium subglobosum LB1]|uniref:hypothetical protein n=1 Tax=Acytostelium subglobosum LB1 TaxID=1410327 RepID=UPI000644F854|nr:hypothetical protein SAMD00019534_050750 [Acytostelium subglobosum LB1]GAM21900.1 hypothetical protein SAMD00019534_050750 [Acytostelium subglobosum LB1]|eukprot:XP_012755000.1 hypothetical protein SAMD00019534_050750 [Acytostelium subglobosum LB1]
MALLIRSYLRGLAKMIGDVAKRQGSSFLVYIDKNHYYRLHFLYFLLTGFFGACIIVSIEAAYSSASFIDCLYTAYSSITSTGLLTVDIARMSVPTQIVMAILIQLGSTVMLTLNVVLIRRYYLRRAYRKRRSFSIDLAEVDGHINGAALDNDNNNNNDDNHDIIMSGVSSLDDPGTSKENIKTSQTIPRINPGVTLDQPLFSSSHSAAGHQDNFHHQYDMQDNLITPAEADKDIQIDADSLFILEHNIEYRSLGKLLYIIPIYQTVVYLIGFIVLVSLATSSSSSVAITLQKNKINGVWFSIFNTLSAFNNVGVTLVTDNMVQFNQHSFLLLVISMLVVLGNTMFPVVLRLIIWCMNKISKDKEPYEHLLNNPRTVYTHLFQAKPTLILLGVWFLFNFSQISLMAILEANEKAFATLSPSDTFMNYLFHSVSTRTGGFNSIDLSQLSKSVLLLFVGLMFVSSYPFVISLKGSAVNGKYQSSAAEESRAKVVMKDLLIRDIFILYLCTLIIGILEETALDSQALGNNVTVFHIIFEVVSAFGTVGLSMGYPGINSSFSTVLTKSSKLVIIIVMLLGRHRSLPDSVDNAVHIEEKDVVAKFLKKRLRRLKY